MEIQVASQVVVGSVNMFKNPTILRANNFRLELEEKLVGCRGIISLFYIKDTLRALAKCIF